MADTLILNNSIWPNGMVTNSDDIDVFSPLGTIKVAVPTSSSEWPKGDKLVSPFVYEDGKLVGFIDTKALTTDSQTLIYLPYEHIEVEFSSIDKGQLQIHAPKATVKKASWKNSGKEDIPEVQFKYKGCTTVDNVTTVDTNYQTTDIVNGVWSEPLWDLTDGYYMFYNTNLESFSSDLSSLTNGEYMFLYCTNLESFSSDLSSLTYGTSMFNYCTNLESFTSDLSSLTNGSYMFASCTNLTTFTSDLSSLTKGDIMFSNCSKLTSFSSDLPSLTNGGRMFNKCSNLTSFSFNLSSLTNGYQMFKDCSNLESFSSDLSSLTDGRSMFNYCTNLESFSSDLPSLTNGYEMFNSCKLDAQSVANIIHFIPQRDTKPTSETGNGNITIGLGITNTEEAKQAFAEEIGYTDWTDINNGFDNKNWVVQWQFNGEASTFDLRSPRPSTAVFTRLEEVIIPTDENSFYDYTSQDGSKFYNLNWFHETTGSTDGYTQFNSLEEAITHFNIKPIEK